MNFNPPSPAQNKSMGKIKGNEAAMPYVLTDEANSKDTDFQPGLTIRQHFANSAPDEIPDWFKHIEPEKKYKQTPHWNDIKDEADKKLCGGWVNDPCWDLPEHLQWFQVDFENSIQGRYDWELENKKQRHFQWRTYYADNLIAELNK